MALEEWCHLSIWRGNWEGDCCLLFRKFFGFFGVKIKCFGKQLALV